MRLSPGDLNIETPSKHEASRRKRIHFGAAAGSFVNLSSEHVRFGKRTCDSNWTDISRVEAITGIVAEKHVQSVRLVVRDYYDLCNESNNFISTAFVEILN